MGENADSKMWEGISSKIECHMKINDIEALLSDIGELFSNFENLDPDKAWELAKKVYNNYKDYYPIVRLFITGIPLNYHLLPNKTEAWQIFVGIPDYLDPLIREDSEEYLLLMLQGENDTLDILKVWKLLKKGSEENSPKVRGEAGYTICEYIALNKDFPSEKGWEIIDVLLNDPENKVKERVLQGLSDFYQELPQDKVEKYGLNLLNENSKEIKEVSLEIAIQSAKVQAEKRDYEQAIKSLKIVLSHFKSYFRRVMFGLSIIMLLFIFLIYIIKDLWVFILFNAPFLLLVPILTIFVLWKLLKLEISSKMIVLYFFTTFIPIFFLYPLFYAIVSFILSLTPEVNVYLILGIILSTIMVSLTIPHRINMLILNGTKLLRKSHKYHVAIGLYNYFNGRKYIVNYLEAGNSEDKLKYLKKAIEKFSKSVNSYNKLKFGLEEELILCPYCLNFYQGLEIYEKSFNNPKQSEVIKLERKIEKSRIIMNDTGKGSQKLNDSLNEFLKTIQIQVKLEGSLKKSSDSDVSDKIRIDKQIKDKSKEIDNIIRNINNIISEIESHDLPIVLEILKSKTDEISGLNEFTQKGLLGYNTLFIKKKHNKISILAFILGIFTIILGSLLSSIGLVTFGTICTVVSGIIMGYTLLKKTPQY